ncbi:DUF4432 family protein [Paenibacillus koleovorans]|uniref:DUF4432 family protein n=1 Tax=Paenibacillus koleovorans TaxID=121608 RepID=UPI000FDC25C0|nr:DUF4432 family protein [Paenibacillus koleovorans]
MGQVYRKQRNYGCRIHDQYTYFGMRTVVLENDQVRVSILPDKGTEVYEFLYKPRDLDYMWLSENGVQPPNAYLPTSPDPISTFIDYYPGGWQEVFPNGGPTSTYKGATFGQHGEVAHMPWDHDIVEDTPERIAVRFSVRTKKMPYRLTKTMSLTLGSASLQLEEELVNESEVELEYMWGQHLAFGRPFVEPGCTVRMPEGVRVIAETADVSDADAGRVRREPREFAWPYGAAVPSTDSAAVGGDGSGRIDLSVLPPAGTASEIVYLTGFGPTGQYELENRRLSAGIRVEWDAEALPYLWYWQEFGATKGYPWFGRHYNIGLEPFCGYPTHGLAEAVRNGSAGRIGPRETRIFSLAVTPFTL